MVGTPSYKCNTKTKTEDCSCQDLSHLSVIIRIISSQLSTHVFMWGVVEDVHVTYDDVSFKHTVNETEEEAWDSFIDVVNKGFGNIKNLDDRNAPKGMLARFKKQNRKMSLKIHFLHSQAKSFLENLGVLCKKPEGRFPQDALEKVRRSQRRWDFTMMTEECLNAEYR
ncbi:hypothetical protein AVEN_169968-1 [Araneus ventricosus]|uniref:Uncharacterized protein n=1 Tax=Araneus ventricosus TaxID=182803 RepID=A0A4Y2TQR8_ARAVE|nr:hypothetical protein AVEN_169968-1 [Araneus ventricosus]